VFDLHNIKQCILILFSAALGLLIRNRTYSRRAPDLTIFWIFQVASFFMGMVWVYFLCNMIVDLLVIFGVLTGVSASLLGLTVLSWGNSIGDAIASASVSRNGFSEMAFVGCVSGSLFNLLFGLGLTLAFAHRSTTDSTQVIDFKALDKEGRATLVMIVASICTLLVLMSLTAASDWCLKRWHAYILIGLYAFTVGSTMFIYF
jgi:sodium/potassium/calcium exchanger 6